MRAEARGGKGEGILGWHLRAISAYTWCVMEKGPQRKWLHRIGKADTAECDCHQQQMGEHLVERCTLLTEARKPVEKEDMRRWKDRLVSRQQEKKKGPVEPENENEKEPDKLETFFCQLYDFHNPPVSAPAPVFSSAPPVLSSPFVSAAVSTSDHFSPSALSSPFVSAAVSTVVSPVPTSCIGTNQ